MKELILEVEHHGKNNKALIGFNSLAEADRILKSKGFERIAQDILWCGLDKDGNEVSVMEPTVVNPEMLLKVNEK